MKKIFNIVAVMMLLMTSILAPVSINAQDKKKVMTTFYPVYYLANKIGGDKIEVSMLLDQGQGAHDYESTAKDIVKIQETDLFIYQDDEMEFFVKDILGSLDQNKTKVLESTKDIELLAGSDHSVHEHEGEAAHEHEGEESHDHEGEAAHDHEGEESHDHEGEAAHNHEGEESHDHEGHSHELDPHTWLDPKVYALQAENVKNALIEMDPENQAAYEENSKKLEEELIALDKEYEAALKDLDKRTLVVQHAAFGYLTHAYDLKQVAISGLNTTKEPSAKVMAEMQQFMKDNGNQVIFVDPSISSNIAKTVAESTGAKLLPLRTLEVVSQKEMESGQDYLSLMRENLKQLIQNK